MLAKKAKLILIWWSLLTAVLCLLLPVANIAEAGWPKNYNEKTLLKLFSIDFLEGRINYLLYSIGVSGFYEKVVVGRDGWLFLGDRYGAGLSKGRNIISKPDADIDKWVRSMSARRQWLASEDIPMVFAVAPNKHSVYGEFMPSWASIEHPNSTDRLIEKAEALGLPIIDMRVELIKQKQTHQYLYNKTDTHWTQLGAYFGYRELMRALSKLVENLNYVGMDQFDSKVIERRPCCMAKMLKIQPYMEKNYDFGHRINFEGIRAPICILHRGKQGNDLGVCEETNSRPISLPSGVIVEVTNGAARNELSVLFVKDSFGLAHGRLINDAFTKIWHTHYSTIPNEKTFRDLIQTLRPEVVIYQIVERSVFRSPFYQFSGK